MTSSPPDSVDPRDSDTSSTSRRAFLRGGTLAMAGTLLGGAGGALARPAGRGSAAAPAAQDGAALRVYLGDLNGNGFVTVDDLRLAERATGAQRGFGLTPLPGYDFRADLFGRGSVGVEDVAAVRDILERVRGFERVPVFRPITVGWHYGWYNSPTRNPEQQTVKFLGGDYASSDPHTESTFNRLKNEFGITVDALSWIAPWRNPEVERNYRAGYFRSAGLGTRHAALLYESVINLPTVGRRVYFLGPGVRASLVRDFGAMARFLAELRDTTPARIFRLDGRPVIFLFAAHAWGLEVNRAAEFDAMDVAIEVAREEFAAIFGNEPYLVGGDMLLTLSDGVGRDRARRVPNFDAVFMYHHKTNARAALVVGERMNAEYVERTRQLMQDNFDALGDMRNRFTGQRVLLIPSLAAGFAKAGQPSLRTDRAGYANFMKLAYNYYVDRYLPRGPGALLGTPRLPAPVVTVGSWNEEFEGHALLPAQFNDSVSPVKQGGFELAMAVKQVFGWNHYAATPLSEFPPPQ